MGVQQFPTRSAVTVQPIGALGTYTLAVPLQPGLYRLTTDTTQTFTAQQLYFQTALGFRFGAVMRGGEGYIAIPETVTTVTFTAGTFPLLIGFERFGSYSLIEAPTNVTFTYTAVQAPYTATIGFTLPAGATGIGVYWSDGSFTDLATTTSPKTGVTLPVAPTFGDALPALVVAKDANGVFGYGTPNTSRYGTLVMTSSGTFTKPAWATTGNVLIVGAGGGGGYYGNSRYLGGGGGAGEVIQLTNVTLPPTETVTIGAGGAGGATSAAGGSTSWGTTTAIGGGRGGALNVAPSIGASGGGGRGGSQAGAAGTAGKGSAGGSGGPNGGGAGGGVNGVGGNGGVGNNFNGGSAAAAATYYGLTVGRGGGGGGADGSATGGGVGGGAGGSTYGGGGGGATGFFSTSYGDTYYGAGNGTNGVVIIEITG